MWSLWLRPAMKWETMTTTKMVTTIMLSLISPARGREWQRTSRPVGTLSQAAITSSSRTAMKRYRWRMRWMAISNVNCAISSARCVSYIWSHNTTAHITATNAIIPDYLPKIHHRQTSIKQMLHRTEARLIRIEDFLGNLSSSIENFKEPMAAGKMVKRPANEKQAQIYNEVNNMVRQSHTSSLLLHTHDTLFLPSCRFHSEMMNKSLPFSSMTRKRSVVWSGWRTSCTLLPTRNKPWRDWWVYSWTGCSNSATKEATSSAVEGKSADSSYLPTSYGIAFQLSLLAGIAKLVTKKLSLVSCEPSSSNTSLTCTSNSAKTFSLPPAGMRNAPSSCQTVARSMPECILLILLIQLTRNNKPQVNNGVKLTRMNPQVNDWATDLRRKAHQIKRVRICRGSSNGIISISITNKFMCSNGKWMCAE